MKINYIKIISILLIVFTVNTINAQNGKIKGSRNVIQVSEDLKPFTAIKATDGLEITLIKDSKTGFDLEIDDNLVDIIMFDIKDSLLVVSKRKTIRSSKKLDIIVRFQELNAITVNDKSKISTSSIIKADSFEGNFMSGGSFEGEIDATTAVITANESSKVKLDYKGDDITLNLSDNATITMDVNTDVFELTAAGRSDSNIKGNANTATINVNDTAEVKARTFDVDILNINGRDSSSTIITTDKEVVIDLNHKSSLQLYGVPVITVKQLAGTSKILKKE